MEKRFTFGEICELIQYAAEQGYTGRVNLFLNIEEDGMTVDKMKSIIDDAVRIQKQHEKDLQ